MDRRLASTSFEWSKKKQAGAFQDLIYDYPQIIFKETINVYVMPRYPEDTKSSLKNEEQHYFFKLLKQLLETTSDPEDGSEAHIQHNGNTLTLDYWSQKCKVSIRNANWEISWQKVVLTKDVYLLWRHAFKEPLSEESLQRVQNELKIIGLQNKKNKDCFSLAKTKFIQEPECIQSNMTLSIVCDDIILSFVSGEGKNVATVLYDSNKGKPRQATTSIEEKYDRLPGNCQCGHKILI